MKVHYELMKTNYIPKLNEEHSGKQGLRIPFHSFFGLTICYSFIYFSFSFNLLGVTLVNIIMQISGSQFHIASFVYCTVCSPPQVNSSSITIYSPSYLSPTIPTLLSMSMSILFFSSIPLPTNTPLNSCQPALCLWICLYFACQSTLLIKFHI